MHTGADVERVEPSGRGVRPCTWPTGLVLSGDAVLVATGRRTDLAALGVGALGLDEGGRSIPVDGRMRVQPGVWAVGDITGKGAFTHVAMFQARLCVADILGSPLPEADYRALPRVTFTDPEIGSVGVTEAQAREQGGDVTVLQEPVGRVRPRLDPPRRGPRQARGA